MKARFPLLLAVALLLCHAAPAVAAVEERALVLQGAKVYPSPTAGPIDNAVVLIQHGQIVAVGRRTELKAPTSAQVIDCTGKVIVAGFWNSGLARYSRLAHLKSQLIFQAAFKRAGGERDAHRLSRAGRGSSERCEKFFQSGVHDQRRRNYLLWSCQTELTFTGVHSRC